LHVLVYGWTGRDPAAGGGGALAAPAAAKAPDARAPAAFVMTGTGGLTRRARRELGAPTGRAAGGVLAGLAAPRPEPGEPWVASCVAPTPDARPRRSRTLGIRVPASGRRTRPPTSLVLPRGSDPCTAIRHSSGEACVDSFPRRTWVSSGPAGPRLDGPQRARISSRGLDEITTYLDAWNEQNPVRRRELLDRSVTKEVVVAHPTFGRTVGTDPLADHIARYQRAMPGTKIVLASAIDIHNGFARYAWSVVDATGNPTMDGIDVVELADDGRLKLIVLFHGSFTA
jgi:hypothetical protein